MSDFEAYLDGMLHERPVMSFERYGQMVHQGAWPDIVAKAKRLIQDGQVTVLRNAPHHVMAHVIGDHGEYNTEISRTDPASNVIEQWSCECPWDQFAFNRTRRWKKFEGRVCSHALATYWKGLSTPLDFQPDGGPSPGQNQGPAVDRIPAPGTIPPPSERSFGPETPNPMTGDNYIQQLQQLRDQVKQRIKNKQPYLPGENQNLQLPGMRPLSPNQQPPSTQDLIMGPEPETPFRYPEMQQFQRDNLKLFDLNAPPWNPTPVPPQLPVSVPNADPPDAMNPIDGIGFSSIRMIRPIFGATDDDFTTWFQTAKQRGRPTYGQVVRRGVYLEARGGKQPMPEAQPYDQWPDGTPRYRKMDLGYNPDTGQRMRADEVGPHGSIGPPEQRDVHMEVPLNTRCEVTELEPLLKWCHIIVPVPNASFYEPQTMEGWVSYADVKPLDDANNPFIRRRGSAWDPDWWRQDQEHDEPHTMAKQILQQADADLEQKHTSMSPDQFWPYLQKVIQQILEQWKTLPDVPSDDPYEQSVGRGQFDFYRNMEADSIQDSTDLLWEFRREWSERIRLDFLRRRTVQVIPSVIDMMLNLRQAFQEGQWEQASDAWEKVDQFIRGETQDFKTLRDQAWHGNGAQWEGATDELKKQLGPLYDVMSTMTYIPSSLGGYVHSFLQWAYGTGYQPDDLEGWREHHTDNITMQNALGNLPDEKVEPMFGHLDRVEKEYAYIIEQIDALMQMLVTAMQTEQEALPAQAADTFPTDWLSKRLARWNQLKS